MKKYNFILLIAVSFLLSCSKSKSDSNQSGGFTTKPEAKAQFDRSGFGLYKGVFVGSTGYIIVDINNSNNVTATLVIDGRRVTYTNRNNNITQGAPISILFENGSDSFVFTANADGSNPLVSSVNIAGHTGANIVVLKETSSSLVRCMEGTYSGFNKGIWNAVVQGRNCKGLARNTDNGYTTTGTGTLDNNNNLTGMTDDNATSFSGVLNSDNGNGTWRNNLTGPLVNGTWKVTRTY